MHTVRFNGVSVSVNGLVLVSNRKTLPTDSGVYLVICNSDVVYIGRAMNLRKRWANHHRKDQVLHLDQYATIAYVFGSDCQLEELERSLIRDMHPRLNRSPERSFGGTRKPMSAEQIEASQRCRDILRGAREQFRAMGMNIPRYL